MALDPEVKQLRKENRHLRGLTEALKKSLLESWEHEKKSRKHFWNFFIDYRARKILPPRMYKLLVIRYGFEDGMTHTLEEVAQEFGVTRERIRQMEYKAADMINSDYNPN